jgi:polysaccharide transporter, PST family
MRQPRRLSRLVSGVLGAESLLAILGVCGAIIFREFNQHIAASNLLFWMGTIWGVFQTINMLWFFQGLERMRLASALEIAGKVTATLSIFVLVRRPEDGWKVMAAQCLGCAVAHGVTVLLTNSLVSRPILD